RAAPGARVRAGHPPGRPPVRGHPRDGAAAGPDPRARCRLPRSRATGLVPGVPDADRAAGADGPRRAVLIRGPGARGRVASRRPLPPGRRRPSGRTLEVRSEPDERRRAMPQYLYQVAYTPESLAAQMKHPQDRLQIVGKQLADAVGAKILAGGYSPR